MNFRRELYSPENLLVQCSGWNQWQGQIWDTWPQGSVKIKISLPGLSNPAPWLWFSSFLVSCWAGQCQSENGYKRCELVSDERRGSQWAVEFVLDCSAAGTARKGPQRQGWERCWSVCEEQQEQGCQLECSCCWLCLPCCCASRARSSALGCGTKGSAGLGGGLRTAAVKEFGVGSESLHGFVCSQRTQKGVYLGRMNSSASYQWLCSLCSSTNVLQNSSCLLEHNPWTVWYHWGILPHTLSLDSVETGLMTHEECSSVADFSGFTAMVINNLHPAAWWGGNLLLGLCSTFCSSEQ